MRHVLVAIVAGSIVSSCGLLASNSSEPSQSGVSSPSLPDTGVPKPPGAETFQSDKSANPKQWFSYRSPKGIYTVKFPGEPDEKTDRIETPAGPADIVFVRYQDRQAGKVFLFSHHAIPLPKDQYLDLDRAFNGIRDRVADEISAKVIGERTIEQNGYPGREFDLNREGRYSAKARVFYANGVLYQALVGAENEDLSAPAIETFLSSIAVDGSQAQSSEKPSKPDQS